MVDPTAPTCTVMVLAPGIGPTATVVAEGPGSGAGAVLLPVVELPVEPAIPLVIAALDELLGRPVTVLRATATTWDSTFDATGMVVEIDVVQAPLPDGLAFQDLDPADLASVSPLAAHQSLGEWLDERAHGWSDLRPAWSRPGWLPRASAWMVERMAEAGYDRPEQPRIHHMWGISVVLASTSSNGTAYLKCSGAAFPHEAVLTRALAARTPALFPDVVAVEGDQGWLLMRELPGPELGERPEGEWGAGLVALAQVQRSWLGRPDELVALGARPRPVSGLAGWVEETVGDEDLMTRLGPGDRAAWLRALPLLLETCSRLGDLGPGPSLVHGDFHPWNAAAGVAGVRIFDWTDAAVSHPFLDLVTYVMRADAVEARQELMDRYLDCWTDELPASDLREAGRLALVVGALHQVQTYTELVPTILPDDRGPLDGGDVQWMRRSITRLDHGLRGDY